MENNRKWLIIVLMLFIVNSCGDKDDPITCDCPNEATHLKLGSNNIACPADACPHEGKDCTVKVNETLNVGGIKVIKEPGVSTADFNMILTELNIVMSEALTPDQINNFKTNFPEIRVISGTGISHVGKVMTIGFNEDSYSIYNYLLIDNMLVNSQQTKTEWLANNKGHEWVGKLI